MNDASSTPKSSGLRRPGSSPKPKSTSGSVAGLQAAVAAGREEVTADRSAAVPTPTPVKAPTRRLNADVDLELHRWFKSYAHKAEGQMSDVVRALLLELQDDEALQQRVRARLEQLAK